MARPQKVTVPSLTSFKKKKKKIVMVTAYDATFARLVDQAGVDMVLVGDSLGMVIQGHDNTIPVTLEDTVYHCKAVSRGLTRAHLCGDMPFMTYKVSPDKALESAGRLTQEGRVESVKLEGGVEMADTILRITTAGIPVVGHVGLTPQSVHAVGGFKMRGKSGFDRARIIEDAKAVTEAGAFCVVLESMPLELAESITQEISAPTIGIGAGARCDGQVLVIYDMLGMNEEFTPRFLKRYAEMGKATRDAVTAFAEDVRGGVFPAREHSVSVEDPSKKNTGPVYGTVPHKNTTH